MELALYSAATGMEAQQRNLDIIANDMANVNTTAYKRTHNEFKDLIYQNLKPIGVDPGDGTNAPTGVQVGNGTQLAATTKVFTQGQLTQTGNEMDVAIEGNGFFEVNMPDGRTVYTRDGSLKVNSNGKVVNAEGLELGSGFQDIPINKEDVGISENGTVSVRLSDGTVQTFKIQLAKFSNPSGLRSLGNNLFEATDASGEAVLGDAGQDGFGNLRQHYLEMSNVNVVQSMVNMIIAQRAYEINSKSIQTADEMMSRVTQLKH